MSTRHRVPCGISVITLGRIPILNLYDQDIAEMQLEEIVMATKSMKKRSFFVASTDNPLVESTREIWLAGLGSLAMARQEGEKLGKRSKKLFEQLVSEGEKFEKSRLKTIRETLDEAAEQFEKTTKKAENQLRAMVEQPEKVEVYHLVPKGEGWTIRREGKDNDISLHDRKASALEAARGIAHAHEPARVVVHRADGTVQTSYSYE
jgi:poly(hydroxyalkanoate) granule-associated protein